MFSNNREYRVHRCLGCLFLCSLTLCLTLGNVSISTQKLHIGQVVKAESTDASKLVQQGLELYQAGDVRGAIQRWEKALILYQRNNDSAGSVIVQENLARSHKQIGQNEEAIKYWTQVRAYYRQVGKLQQEGRSITEQAQAYSSLGQPKEAISLLCNPDKHGNCSNGSTVQIARASKDLLGEAAALGALGETYRLLGKYDFASKNLEKSLEIAQKLNNLALRLSILNSLGNTHISLAQVKYRRANSATQRGETGDAKKLQQDGKQEDAKALKYLQQSSEIARGQKDFLTEIRSLLRIIPLYYRNNTTEIATSSLQQATSLLEKLPDSRGRVYATIDLVRLLQSSPGQATSSRITCLSSDNSAKAEALLNQAVTVAQRLQDFRAESFALGELGHIYECQKEYSRAMEITNKARLAAEQALKAQDSLYLWEWQNGRIFKSLGKTKEAISAYERAIKTLNTIRQDILTANRDIQFDFRDTIEPIYRDLVELRLSSEQPLQIASKSLLSQAEDSKDNFKYILKTIDSLKLAELQNFFGNDCIITAFSADSISEISSKIDAQKRKTAFINTIILENKTAVILTLPDGQNKLSLIPVTRQEFINQINEFRRSLERSFDDDEYNTKQATEIYSWLIYPFAKYLNKADIKTLVFIQDGILRSVPMAALYDREENKFLIQKYAIATIPSINLIDTKALQRNNLRLLALGITERAVIDNNRSFDPLDNVNTEITGVLEKISGKKLLDNDFTTDKLEAELKKQSYSIIHIATHGEFASEPTDTFIVAGKVKGVNEKISFDKLEEQIRKVSRNTQPLEILALTACKTAIGDERSTLGMAGVAIQAGVKSALASLWAIKDVSTPEIATAFYRKLLSNSNITKAEALQAAQVALIEGKEIDGEKFTHPGYWSPFILIGNWL